MKTVFQNQDLRDASCVERWYEAWRCISIAALPLRRGYATRLPLYIYERGGQLWFDVQVTGEESVPGPDARATPVWEVSVHQPSLTVRYWIAKESRQLLRTETDLGGGRRMVMTL